MISARRAREADLDKFFLGAKGGRNLSADGRTFQSRYRAVNSHKMPRRPGQANGSRECAPDDRLRAPGPNACAGATRGKVGCKPLKFRGTGYPAFAGG